MLRFEPSEWSAYLAGWLREALSARLSIRPVLAARKRVLAGEAALAAIKDEEGEVVGAVLYSVEGDALFIEAVGGDAQAVILRGLWEWAHDLAREAGLKAVIAHTNRLDMAHWLSRRGADLSAMLRIEVGHGR